MKTKNIVLGILSFVLAIGSAFASLLAPTTIFVKGRVLEDDPITCINTGATCDHPNGSACKVQVNATKGPDITTKTYRNSSCSLPLTNTVPNTVVSSASVYELVEF